ncbi:hypothetical protein BGX28_000634 [Mortierella sp. GBA30]|nr:hypothetical protein BGX28_000634 [Mortierella sp. GBA30]
MSDSQKSQQHTMASSATQPQPGESTGAGSAGTGTATQQQPPAVEQPKKAKRKRITPEQLEDLVGLFEKTDTPSFEIRESLAKKLGMTNREIQVWFQNRRAKANRVKINEQAALHHQQHLQMQQQQQQQQQQQHLQGHHPHHPHHHRSNSHNGFGFHPHHVHSAPATPLQPSPGHHHGHHSHPSHHPGSASTSNSTSSSGMLSTQDSSSYGYFGNGSSPPPVIMPTPTPRVHSSSSHGQPNRRPSSLYNIGSYGHHLQTQQFQQQKPAAGPFQPQHSSSSYGQPSTNHGHPSPGHGHAHSNSYSHPTGPYGMDIILPANASSPSASSQRPVILPPPISTLPQPHRQGQGLEAHEDSGRVSRHARTMSDSHPTDYMSPTSISPTSPPTERPLDSQCRDEFEEDSPSSAAHSSPFANGNSTNVNRHSASLANFGLKQPVMKMEEQEPSVILRERQPANGYYNNAVQASKNRRSYDDALYDDEHQRLMRDNFNMDTRLVISEDEPRSGSAIDLLAYAAAFIQESEEHKKDSVMDKDVEEKRDSLGLLSSNKRQSFHGPTGYPSKEPFSEDRYSSSMSWEASPPAGSSNEVMPIPRRRGGDDSPYAPRRPRPVTYGGSGFLYDHQENQFMPQSPSSSLLSYGRSSSSFGSSSRRMGNRNSTEVGNSQMLLQRGLTRPRRSSSTATSNNMMNHHHMSSASTMPVLPPIISENQLLSPAMVPSPPPLGGSRLSRQDSGNTRESPGSDSFSRDSYNESHASSRDDMEDIEDEETEFNRLRAAKRRSGNANSFFGMGVQ